MMVPGELEIRGRAVYEHGMRRCVEVLEHSRRTPNRMEAKASEQASLLKDAADAVCSCGSDATNSLVDAVWEGCLQCCSKYIEEAGKLVDGTTALVEAVKGGHRDIIRLLLPLEGHLADASGKKAYCHVAGRDREIFDEVLGAIEPEFYALVREMREAPCICQQPQDRLYESVGRGCVRCCASQVGLMRESMAEVIAATKAAEPRCLAPVAFLASLAAQPNYKMRSPELVLAVKNGLYEAAVVLLGKQRDARDSAGLKAADHAVSVHDARLWALFPEDITEEYRADLEAAHAEKCVCGPLKARDLSFAVKRGCLRCSATCLWQAGCDSPRATELMEAVRKSDVRFARLLRHTQAGIQDGTGRSALMYAAEAGSIEAVRLLTQREARLQDKQGMTALALASRRGHAQVVRHLTGLEAGLRDHLGRTALAHAMLHNRAEVARALFPLERHIGDDAGRGAEEYAFHCNDVGIWRLFSPEITREEGAERRREALSRCVCDVAAENLFEAADNDCLRCCIEFEGQVGQTDAGRTALMKAAQWDNEDIVRLLMPEEAGLRGDFGETALMDAAFFGNLGPVRLLLPLEKDIKDHSQGSVCMFAAKSKHEPTLEHVLREMWPGAYEDLQEARNSPCTCEGKSRTLNSAAERGCLRCAASFIHEAGDYDGDTAIARAARNGHKYVAELLIPFEAEMTGAGCTTALMEAAKQGHAEIVEMLAPHEAGIASVRGDTALMHAVTQGCIACVDILQQSHAELDASKVHPYMLQLRGGGLGAALQHKREWISVFDSGLNVLDLAILRGRPVFTQALTRDPEARGHLAKSTAGMKYKSNCGALRYLSTAKSLQFFRYPLELICAADARARSKLISFALFDHPRPAIRLLRPFCSPRYSDICNAAQWLGNEGNTEGAIVAVKNVGALGSVERLPVYQPAFLDGIRSGLVANPLRRKQLALAAEQRFKYFKRGGDCEPSDGQTNDDDSEDGNWDGLPDETNFAWREVHAEAAFNCFVLLEARDGRWAALPPTRSLHLPLPARPAAAKLAHNRAAIRGAFWYLCERVREMLEE